KTVPSVAAGTAVWLARQKFHIKENVLTLKSGIRPYRERKRDTSCSSGSLLFYTTFKVLVFLK
ncbi:MAG: hypothetical protein LBB82_04835, partial [Treponema sp.]|nr:hypothetical protein [Treponema sp.]